MNVSDEAVLNDVREGVAVKIKMFFYSYHYSLNSVVCDVFSAGTT